MTDSNKFSRRQVLGAAAGVTVAGAAGVIAAATPAHAAKVPQKAVKYQDEPKGDARCETCVLFEAPSSCKNVDGTVSPQGWCMIYAKKPA
jgi:hypothetical protein